MYVRVLETLFAISIYLQGISYVVSENPMLISAKDTIDENDLQKNKELVDSQNTANDLPNDAGGYDDVKDEVKNGVGTSYDQGKGNFAEANSYEGMNGGTNNGNNEVIPFGAYDYVSGTDDYYDSNEGYGQPHPLTQSLPGSNEILDRNKPEPGFDLTTDEIVKLKLWGDAVIPYYIDVFSFSDKVMRDKIRSFLSSVNSLTALNFMELPSPPTDNSRWVFFLNRRGLLGCADHSIRNFTNAGVQKVVLGYHCMSMEGELAEAVLSIAGVPAQHNAPDRDYYIKINEMNIIPEKKYLFEKRSDDEWLFHDMEYDFHSAGHFHSYKHSINGRATIVPQKESRDVTVGESKVLTAQDIQKLRMLYNYIAKKKLLQAPDCHKLFKPGKKFRQYKPSDKSLKPRPKPFRFTGESPDAPLVEDDVVVAPDQNSDQQEGDVSQYSDIVNTNVINNENGENMPEVNENEESLDDYNHDDYETQNENNNSVHNSSYENAPNYGSAIQIPLGEDETDNLSPSDFYNKDEKKPVIINIGKGNIHLAGEQDKNKDEEPIKLLSLKFSQPNKRTPKKPDLLTALSDFETDEEHNRRGKKQKRGLRSNKQVLSDLKNDLKNVSKSNKMKR